MEYETIIAAYETVQGADAVIRDLKKAGVAADGIGRHVKGAVPASNRSESVGAFWTGLLGIETEAVVTARVPVKDSESALAVLEAHHPIDLEERSGGDDEAEVMALAEETLQVGKRAVAGETTRVRRYTVESPVEEQVSLRRESVSPIPVMRQSDEIRRLHAEGTKPMHIARQLGIARSSVYRVLGPEADPNTLAIAAAWAAASAAYARLQALRNDAQAAYDRETLAQNVADEWGDWRRSASSPGFEVEFRSACVVLKAAEDEFCDASDRADAGWREWGTARALLRGLLLAKYGIQDD